MSVRRFQYQSLVEPIVFGPEIVTVDKWFAPLSLPPVMKKRGLNAAAQQTLAFEPLPRVSFGWFRALSEPVRIKRGIHPSRVPFFFYGMNPLTITPFSWFAPLTEPVRQKKGLRASLQQALAAPPRVLPTPTIFGTLNATETKDTFLAAGVPFNRPTSGELGIQERDQTPGELGVSKQPPPLFARMSIRTQ